ncbi:MAG: PAS domain S-box protein [Rhizobiales bacterium]|nr:PAS domain S-box protein [Hyphomicrobiales bacterium]
MSRNPLDELERLESQPRPAWLWDFERCRIVWANRAGLAFWGENTLIDLIDRRFDTELAALRQIVHLGAELGEQDEHRERFVFHPRGGERALSALARKVALDDGRAGILLVAAGEEADSEETTRGRLLDAVADALPIPVAVLDRHASLVYANQACRALTAGLPSGTAGVLGGWFADEARGRALIDEALGVGSVSEVETINTRYGPRAHRITVIRIAAPIHGRLALLFTFDDIEDRRRVGEHQDRTRASLQSYLAAAADLAWTLDKDLCVSGISHTASDLPGFEGAELVGETLSAMSQKLNLEITGEIEAGLAAMRGVRGVVVAIGGDGSQALFSALPVNGADGQVTGLSCTLMRIAGPQDAAAAAPLGTPPGVETDDGEGTDRSIAAKSDDAQAARPAGKSDDATFSAIARAIAAHAATEPGETAAASDQDGAADDADRWDEDRVAEEQAAQDGAAQDGAPEEQTAEEQNAAALRIVGGVDHAGDAPANWGALLSLDVSALDALGKPALVHRAFTVIGANRQFLALTGGAGPEKDAASANLLNLFPQERPQLFALQSRFDDGELSASDESETIELHVAGGAPSSAPLTAHAEFVLFDNEPAMLMWFEEHGETARPESNAETAQETPSPRQPARAMAVEGIAAAAALPDATDELGAARERESELRAILNSAADGIVTLDQDGSIRTMNPSAEAIFACNAVDVAGSKLSSLLDEESAKTVDAYLQSVGEGGVNGLYREGREVVANRTDGTAVPLFLTIGPMNVETGPRFCAVIRDITQWKRSESELRRAKSEAEEASNQKSDFLARMSHELRTPLNAIIGFSEVMSEEKFGPIANDRYKEYLTDIRTSGEHLLSLINDLLDLSKIEAGKLELNFGSVDLSQLIQQGVQLMQPQAARERVIIRVSSPEDLPPVVADERALRQILLNLLSNAIKFTPPGGQVILSTMLDEAGPLQIRIRDTGQGMSADELRQALEPFRQVNIAEARTEVPGTGLGLPLTKALVEANRAELRIESTPGAGTLVQIIFPPERVLAG